MRKNRMVLRTFRGRPNPYRYAVEWVIRDGQWSSADGAVYESVSEAMCSAERLSELGIKTRVIQFMEY